MRKTLRATFSDVRIPAAVISLLLSAWVVLLDDVVNSDGILYLSTAELLARGEWKATFEAYRWPLYPLLISFVSRITSLSFESSAHVLNAGLTALIVVSFLTLIRELGGDRKTVIAAAFVVLLYPGLNEYRSFVIRDFGYLAFYLLSVVLFVKNVKSPQWGFRIGWVIAMLVASLFRIEGFVFLFLLPFLQQLRRATTFPAKVRVFTTLAIVSFFLVTLVAWWISGATIMPGPTTVASSLAALLQGLWQNITSNISTKLAVIAGQLPDRYSREFAHTAFIIALALIFLVETLVRLTPLHAVLTCHALYRRLVFPVQGARAIWIWLIILNLGILAVIMFARLFLTGRFPLALSLTVMLAVPFSLSALYEGWRENRASTIKKNWVFPIVCVFFLVTAAVDELYSPTSKAHLKEAGTWIRDHTPAQSTFFSNSRVVMFYSGKSAKYAYKKYGWNETLDFIKSDKWLGYDYLAFRVKRKQRDQEAVLAEMLGRDPVAQFTNRKGEKVSIFRVR
ncbi:MAG: hypothetical protein ACE5FE_00960 [Acidiferrobacterales bacterium]